MSAVCVFCSSSLLIDEQYIRLAADVGTELARRGHSLVSGGGRVSMMGAVAAAARAGGAHTVGVIPRALSRVEIADADADELVVVETMRERKALMDSRSDAFLVLPGGIGTLEEMFEAWTAHTLGMHAKPVVVLDPGGFYDPLWTVLRGWGEAGFLRATALDSLIVCRTLEEAMAVLDAPASPEQTSAR